MKIKRDEFYTQLERISPAISTSEKVPALTHIWFGGEYACAFDAELGIQLPLKTDFELGVSGKTLLGLIGGTKSESIELDQTKSSLVVKIGRSSSKLGVLPVDDVPWPFPDDIPAKTPKIEVTEQLLDAMRRLLFVKKPKNPRRVEENGLVLYADGDKITLGVSNGKVAAQLSLEGELPKGADRQVLPRRFVEQVIKQCAPGAALYVLKDALIAESDGLRICTNLLDNEGVTHIPTLINKYAKNAEAKAEIPPGLGEAINRATLLAGNTLEPVIDIAITEKELGLEGVYPLGQVNDDFDLKGDPEDAELTVELGHLSMAMAEAEEFAIVSKAMVIFGADGFIGVLAGGAKA